MIKQFCDACKKEIQQGRDLYKFEYFFHIDGILDHIIGYVDKDLNRVSGRTTHKDLCIVCYNKVVVEAVKKFREIKEG